MEERISGTEYLRAFLARRDLNNSDGGGWGAVRLDSFVGTEGRHPNEYGQYWYPYYQYCSSEVGDYRRVLVTRW